MSPARHTTHNPPAPRSGVEARVAPNLNGWHDSDAGLSQGWVRCSSGLARLHHSRLSTRSPYQLYSFSGYRRVRYDNHGSFVYDSPNLFCCPSGSVRTGLPWVWSEPKLRTHLTSLIPDISACTHASEQVKLTAWMQSQMWSTTCTPANTPCCRQHLVH